MNLSKKLVLSTCSFLIAGLSTQAFANGVPAIDCCSGLEKRVKRLEDKVVEGSSSKITVSGFINRAVAWIDDGQSSNTTHVDNDNYASQLNFDGAHKFNDDISFGAGVTIRLYSNSLRNHTGHRDPDQTAAETASAAENNWGLTRSEVHVSSKKFGTLTIGHGDMASYGTHYYTHLTGAYNFTEPFTFAARSQFKLKNAVGPLPANRGSGLLGQGTNLVPVYIFNPGDSVNVSGRADRIKYVTPRIYGFTLGASHGYHNRGDLWDVVAQFAAKFGEWIVVANTEFARNHTREGTGPATLTPGETGSVGANGTGVTFDQYSASTGLFVPYSITGKSETGLALRLSYAKRDYDKVAHKDGRSIRGTIGYKDKFNELGMSAVELTYGEYRNMTLTTIPTYKVLGQAWIVGVQQDIDKVGAEVYAAYTNMKLKLKNSPFKFKDQDVVLVGARVRF